jgi:hypothetical protein
MRRPASCCGRTIRRCPAGRERLLRRGEPRRRGVEGQGLRRRHRRPPDRASIRKDRQAVWSWTPIDRRKPLHITGAPRIVKGKVHHRQRRRRVRRARLCHRLRRRHRQAGLALLHRARRSRMAEMRAPCASRKTWHRRVLEAWGGGGTVWDSMAYDPELDLLYIGTGNGSPWNQKLRSDGKGDNLFLSSIVALRPDTGEYVWHYQTTPGETWDYTATQHIILADLDDRRAEAQGGDAGAEERLLLRARPRHRPEVLLSARSSCRSPGPRMST